MSCSDKISQMANQTELYKKTNEHDHSKLVILRICRLAIIKALRHKAYVVGRPNKLS